MKSRKYRKSVSFLALLQVLREFLTMLKLAAAVNAVIARPARVLLHDVGLELAGGEQALVAVGAVVAEDALVHAHVGAEAVQAVVGLTAFRTNVLAVEGRRLKGESGAFIRFVEVMNTMAVSCERCTAKLLILARH